MRRWVVVAMALAVGACTRGDQPDAYGNVETTQVTVSAETAGRLVSFDVHEGQMLEPGATVARIDPSELQLQRQQAAALIREGTTVSCARPITTDITPDITYQVQPNFKRLGPRIGKLLPGCKAALGKADGGKLLAELTASGKVTLDIGGEQIDLDNEDIQVRLQAKPGWAAASAVRALSASRAAAARWASALVATSSARRDTASRSAQPRSSIAAISDWSACSRWRASRSSASTRS